MEEFDWKDRSKMFQYLQATQCSASQFGPDDSKKMAEWLRWCPANIPWGDARYLIEYKMKIHAAQRQKKVVQGSYLEGYLWNSDIINWRKDAKRIERDYLMKPGDRVVIMRKPLQRGEKPFVPYRFRQKLQEEYARRGEEKNPTPRVAQIKAPTFSEGSEHKDFEAVTRRRFHSEKEKFQQRLRIISPFGCY
jgi:hypothetical protein